MSERSDENPIEQFEEWKKSCEDGQSDPTETYKRVSNIAVLLCYDLVDKLRHWEKESLSLPEEEIVARVQHMTGVVHQLRTAYLQFGEMDEG